MKEEALKNFDALIRGKLSSGGDIFEAGYLNGIINSIGQNIVVKVEDVEIITLFHVSEKEVVKFGVKVDKFEVVPYSKSDFNN